jgi:hypothetical protein
MPENTDPCGCNAALIQNRYSSASSSDTQFRLASLQVIQQDEYEQFQDKAKGGLTIPVFDVPIGATGDYSEWSVKRNQYLQLQTKQMSLDEARNVVYQSQSLSDSALQAWLGCLKICNKDGFSCWAENVDPTDPIVEVRFKWDPPAGANPIGRVTSSSLSGATPQENNIPVPNALREGLRLSKGETSRFYTRDINQPFNLLVNINDVFTDSVRLPVFLGVKARMDAGQQFTVNFDMLKTPIGTIVPGIYKVKYNGQGSWTATGFNRGDNGENTYTRGIDPSIVPDNYKINIWDAIFIFDDAKDVFYVNDGRLVGHISITNS